MLLRPQKTRHREELGGLSSEFGGLQSPGTRWPVSHEIYGSPWRLRSSWRCLARSAISSTASSFSRKLSARNARCCARREPSQLQRLQSIFASSSGVIAAHFLTPAQMSDVFEISCATGGFFHANQGFQTKNAHGQSRSKLSFVR